MRISVLTFPLSLPYFYSYPYPYPYPHPPIVYCIRNFRYCRRYKDPYSDKNENENENENERNGVGNIAGQNPFLGAPGSREESYSESQSLYARKAILLKEQNHLSQKLQQDSINTDWGEVFDQKAISRRLADMNRARQIEYEIIEVDDEIINLDATYSYNARQTQTQTQAQAQAQGRGGEDSAADTMYGRPSRPRCEGDRIRGYRYVRFK